MSQFQKSVLFNTSAGTDVQYVGGEILIPGLDPIKQSRVIDFSQVNYRAEVSQVVTVGATAYAPSASTRYIVTIGDVSRRNHGLTEAPFVYSYTTPDDITTLGATAALQREAIHLALIAKINAQTTSNYVVAASLLLGTGFTITDVAGYYPYPHQGMNSREGASRVVLATNADGTGFAQTNIAVTTAAVYSVGVGLNLLNNAPIMDFMTGNVISGTVDAPKTFAGASAVSGQKYNCFSITYLSNATIAGVTGTTGLTVKQRLVWVDNGTGSATTNLAGYLAFEKRMHQLAYAVYKNDASTVAEFFDKNFIIQGALGAVPVTTTSLTNKFLTPYGMLNHFNIGTQTIVTGTQAVGGFLMEQDATATEGSAYTPPIWTVNSQQFVVGKTEMTVSAKASFTTPANIVFMVGFRSKEAHQAAFASYQFLATVGTGAAGTAASTYGNLAAGTPVVTAAGLTF